MRIIKRLENKKEKEVGSKRTRREYTDEEKAEIRERLSKIVDKRRAEKKKEDVQELLKKDNVVQITKEVKIQLEDRDLYLEAGDIVEIIPKEIEEQEDGDKGKDDDEDKKKKKKDKDKEKEKDEE